MSLSTSMALAGVAPNSQGKQAAAGGVSSFLKKIGVRGPTLEAEKKAARAAVVNSARRDFEAAVRRADETVTARERAAGAKKRAGLAATEKMLRGGGAPSLASVMREADKGGAVGPEARPVLRSYLQALASDSRGLSGTLQAAEAPEKLRVDRRVFVDAMARLARGEAGAMAAEVEQFRADREAGRRKGPWDTGLYGGAAKPAPKTVKTADDVYREQEAARVAREAGQAQSELARLRAAGDWKVGIYDAADSIEKNVGRAMKPVVDAAVAVNPALSGLKAGAQAIGNATIGAKNTKAGLDLVGDMAGQFPAQYLTLGPRFAADLGVLGDPSIRSRVLTNNALMGAAMAPLDLVDQFEVGKAAATAGRGFFGRAGRAAGRSVADGSVAPVMPGPEVAAAAPVPVGVELGAGPSREELGALLRGETTAAPQPRELFVPQELAGYDPGTTPSLLESPRLRPEVAAEAMAPVEPPKRAGKTQKARTVRADEQPLPMSPPDRAAQIKAENPDGLVAVRVGDFYEFYGKDAEEAAQSLQITLTGRDTPGQGRVAMSGVPFHSVEKYMDALNKAGKTVTIEDNGAIKTYQATPGPVADPAGWSGTHSKDAERARVDEMLAAGRARSEAQSQWINNNPGAEVYELGGVPYVVVEHKRKTYLTRVPSEPDAVPSLRKEDAKQLQGDARELATPTYTPLSESAKARVAKFAGEAEAERAAREAERQAGIAKDSVRAAWGEYAASRLGANGTKKYKGLQVQKDGKGWGVKHLASGKWVAPKLADKLDAQTILVRMADEAGGEWLNGTGNTLTELGITQTELEAARRIRRAPFEGTPGGEMAAVKAAEPAIPERVSGETLEPVIGDARLVDKKLYEVQWPKDKPVTDAALTDLEIEIENRVLNGDVIVVRSDLPEEVIDRAGVVPLRWGASRIIVDTGNPMGARMAAEILDGHEAVNSWRLWRYQWDPKADLLARTTVKNAEGVAAVEARPSVAPERQFGQDSALGGGAYVKSSETVAHDRFTPGPDGSGQGLGGGDRPVVAVANVENLRRGFVESWGLAEEEADAAVALVRARAGQWARETGRDAEEFVGSFIKEIRPDGGEIVDGAMMQKMKAKGSAPKGAAAWVKDEAKFVLLGLESPDVTTAVHELGHVFRRGLAAEDARILEREFGLQPGVWTRDAEEAFATGFERYVRDGIAPTEGLAGVFAKLKSWFLDVYSSVRGTPLEKKVSPELKEVFDRMLGGEAVPAKEVRKAADGGRKGPREFFERTLGRRIELQPDEIARYERIEEIYRRERQSLKDQLAGDLSVAEEANLRRRLILLDRLHREKLDAFHQTTAEWAQIERGLDQATWQEKGGVVEGFSLDAATPDEPLYQGGQKMEKGIVDPLFATHNLGWLDLIRVLELGAIPAPSLAVKGKGFAHKGFGDISLIAKGELADMQKPNRMLWARDAWTPGVRTRQFAASPKNQKQMIVARLNALAQQAGGKANMEGVLKLLGENRQGVDDGYFSSFEALDKIAARFEADNPDVVKHIEKVNWDRWNEGLKLAQDDAEPVKRYLERKLEQFKDGKVENDLGRQEAFYELEKELKELRQEGRYTVADTIIKYGFNLSWNTTPYNHVAGLLEDMDSLIDETASKTYHSVKPVKLILYNDLTSLRKQSVDLESLTPDAVLRSEKGFEPEGLEAVRQKLAKTDWYGEMKIAGLIPLQKFSAAVVPDYVTPRQVRQLQEAGIEDVRFYKAGNEAARALVVKAITDERPEVLFQKGAQDPDEILSSKQDLMESLDEDAGPELGEVYQESKAGKEEGLRRGLAATIGSVFDYLDLQGAEGSVARKAGRTVSRELERVLNLSAQGIATLADNMRQAEKAAYGARVWTGSAKKELEDLARRIHRASTGQSGAMAGITPAQKKVWERWTATNKFLVDEGAALGVMVDRVVKGDVWRALYGEKISFYGVDPKDGNPKELKGFVVGGTGGPDTPGKAASIEIELEGGDLVTLPESRPFTSFSKVAPHRYFPRVLKKEVQQAIVNKSGPLYDKLRAAALHAAETGSSMPPSVEALDRIAQGMTAARRAEADRLIGELGVGANPNLHQAIGTGVGLERQRWPFALPEDFYDFDWEKVTRKHIQSGSMRVARARVWGQDGERLLLSLAELEDPTASHALIEQALGQSSDRSKGQELLRTAISWEGSWQALSKLTGLGTAVKQLTQEAATVGVLGVTPAVRGWGQLMIEAVKEARGAPSLIREVRRSGAIESALLGMVDVEDASSLARKMADIGLTVTGVKPADALLRYQSALAGRSSVEMTVRRLKMKGSKILEGGDYRLLRDWFKYSDREIYDMKLGALREKGAWKLDGEKLMMAYQGGAKTQVRVRQADLPAFMRGHPIMRVMTRFQQFNFGQLRILDWAWEEATQGNVKPLLRMTAAYAGLGWLTNELHRSVMGWLENKERKAPPKDWKDRLAFELARSGMFGWFSDAATALTEPVADDEDLMDRLNNMQSKSSRVGGSVPLLSDAGNVFKGVNEGMATGDWAKAADGTLRRMVVPYGRFAKRGEPDLELVKRVRADIRASMKKEGWSDGAISAVLEKVAPTPPSRIASQEERDWLRRKNALVQQGLSEAEIEDMMPPKPTRGEKKKRTEPPRLTKEDIDAKLPGLIGRPDVAAARREFEKAIGAKK